MNSEIFHTEQGMWLRAEPCAVRFYEPFYHIEGRIRVGYVRTINESW